MSHGSCLSSSSTPSQIWRDSLSWCRWWPKQVWSRGNHLMRGSSPSGSSRATCFVCLSFSELLSASSSRRALYWSLGHAQSCLPSTSWNLCLQPPYIYISFGCFLATVAVSQSECSEFCSRFGFSDLVRAVSAGHAYCLGRTASIARRLLVPCWCMTQIGSCWEQMLMLADRGRSIDLSFV